jgi:hypothetical protein
MDAFVLPALAITIVVTITWLGGKWLGKKQDRALVWPDSDEPAEPGFDSDARR